MFHLGGMYMRLRNVKDAKKIVSESNYVINDPESIKGHFSELFGNDNEIHLEIGMGKGVLNGSKAIHLLKNKRGSC